MRYIILGRNVEMTDNLKEKISSKLDRISKLFDEDVEAKVSVGQEKLLYKVEVTIPIVKRTLRAEVKNQELMAAVDLVVDVVEKQMVKYKNKLRVKSRDNASYKNEFLTVFSEDELKESSDALGKIEKVKKFEIKPMDPEEAVLEMDLLGHSFFVFKDAKSDIVNVVYKRKDGTYGLIAPEN